jgi:hypothetical protein
MGKIRSDSRGPEEKPDCLQPQGAHSYEALAEVSLFPPKLSFFAPAALCGK